MSTTKAITRYSVRKRNQRWLEEHSSFDTETCARLAFLYWRNATQEGGLEWPPELLPEDPEVDLALPRSAFEKTPNSPEKEVSGLEDLDEVPWLI